MKCSKCGHVGPDKDFEKGNRSYNDTVGRCKPCKAKADKAYRTKKDVMPKPFIPVPNMLKRTRVDIGVLRLQKIVDRRLGKEPNRIESNFGIKAILKELNEPYEVCFPETINHYRIVLISLTSVMDIENLIYTFEKYCPETVTAKIIVGGFGVINIKLIVPYIDVAVFGRAEGQINDIINGFSFENTWRKEYDPEVLRQYQIRQPQYLLEGENSIGCRNRCSYCQYGHIRLSIGKAAKYNPGKGIHTPETDWRGLVVDKPGAYITAWDGWSETTRLRVNKHITDDDIILKLHEIGNDKDITSYGIDTHTVSMKVFQIVGYPWETKETVLHDIEKVGLVLADIDKQITNKIILSFLVTPFGPEPLTPMQYDPANIHIDWRATLADVKVYKGEHINAFIVMSISGPFTLVKRVWIHRAEIADLDRFKAVVFNTKIKRMPERYKVPWLLENGHIDPGLFGGVDASGADYLCL
ncbi:hypothetical protein LCGC14_1559830 [marine sediment metagenome]|uniref:Uncharacterized protein n=1 Tax=marine sediment metagenome TaxID=412755 RepID=A0A0F9LNI6_9ZZZZ